MVIHEEGLTHNDVSPHNSLLDEDLDLQICDFNVCSLPGETYSPLCSSEPRYEARALSPNDVSTQADHIFALGPVMYFIITGEDPFSEFDDEELERRFENRDFPASDHLSCGAVI